MRQVLIRRGRIVVENVPAPHVDDGHILVEVAYSLISAGTELSNLASSGKSLAKLAFEQSDRLTRLIDYIRSRGIRKAISKVMERTHAIRPAGYSCSGIVVQVGKGIEGFYQGMPVACAGAGIANHAEVVLVPRNVAVRVPDGCSMRDAASVTLGAIALQGVRRANTNLGEIVAVIGLGLLGQLTVQLLKAGGCTVIGLDVDERRLNVAKQLGADYVLNPGYAIVNSEVSHLTEGYGVDATIITAASKSDAIVQQAMEITRKKGRVVVVGDVGLGLKRSPFYEKEIDFLISCSYGPGRYDPAYEEDGVDYPYAYVRWTENRNMAEYLRLVGQGRVQLAPILEREYDIADAQLAYEELKKETDRPLGVILRYQPSDKSVDLAKFATRVDLGARPASDKVRMAVVGAGGFAKSTHLPNLRKLSSLYHIRAIVTATGSNAKITAQRFTADYSSTDYDEVLKDPDVDAVLICTRHHLHAKMAIKAAKARKAIYLEKPMALSQEELTEVVETLRETGVPFTVGFNRRFSPAARRVKELINNRVNPLIAVYRVNAGYIPLENWVHGKEGGGRIIGEACHMFDLFNYFVGAKVESVDVSAISPATGHILSRDNFVATLKYIDGSVCTLIYTALGAAEVPKEYIEIYCDGKTMVIDDFLELQVYGCKAKGWKGPQDKGHLQQLEAFGRSARDKNGWPIPLNELVSTTEISFLVDSQLRQ